MIYSEVLDNFAYDRKEKPVIDILPIIKKVDPSKLYTQKLQKVIEDKIWSIFEIEKKIPHPDVCKVVYYSLGAPQRDWLISMHQYAKKSDWNNVTKYAGKLINSLPKALPQETGYSISPFRCKIILSALRVIRFMIIRTLDNQVESKTLDAYEKILELIREILKQCHTTKKGLTLHEHSYDHKDFTSSVTTTDKSISELDKPVSHLSIHSGKWEFDSSEDKNWEFTPGNYDCREQFFKPFCINSCKLVGSTENGTIYYHKLIQKIRKEGVGNLLERWKKNCSSALKNDDAGVEIIIKIFELIGEKVPIPKGKKGKILTDLIVDLYDNLPSMNYRWDPTGIDTSRGRSTQIDVAVSSLGVLFLLNSTDATSKKWDEKYYRAGQLIEDVQRLTNLQTHIYPHAFSGLAIASLYNRDKKNHDKLQDKALLASYRIRESLSSVDGSKYYYKALMAHELGATVICLVGMYRAYSKLKNLYSVYDVASDGKLSRSSSRTVASQIKKTLSRVSRKLYDLFNKQDPACIKYSRLHNYSDRKGSAGRAVPVHLARTLAEPIVDGYAKSYCKDACKHLKESLKAYAENLVSLEAMLKGGSVHEGSSGVAPYYYYSSIPFAATAAAYIIAIKNDKSVVPYAKRIFESIMNMRKSRKSYDKLPFKAAYGSSTAVYNNVMAGLTICALRAIIKGGNVIFLNEKIKASDPLD